MSTSFILLQQKIILKLYFKINILQNFNDLKHSIYFLKIFVF